MFAAAAPTNGLELTHQKATSHLCHMISGMGAKHTQALLGDPQVCSHYAWMPENILEVAIRNNNKEPFRVRSHSKATANSQSDRCKLNPRTFIHYWRSSSRSSWVVRMQRVTLPLTSSNGQQPRSWSKTYTYNGKRLPQGLQATVASSSCLCERNEPLLVKSFQEYTSHQGLL